MPGRFRRFPEKNSTAVIGFAHRGDLLGPWLFDDIAKVLSVLKYRKITLGSRGFVRRSIGDARPLVPAGQSGCAFGYTFAREEWSDSFSMGAQTPLLTALAGFESNMGVRAWGGDDHPDGIRRLNINGSSSVYRPTFYRKSGLTDIYGYASGLPNSVSATAKIYGWGIKRTESFEQIDENGDGVALVVHPIVPPGAPNYSEESWVLWVTESDIHQQAGPDFEFDVSDYFDLIDAWPLDYAGSPCPTVTGSHPYYVRTAQRAEYRVGQRDADNPVNPFAILEAGYTNEN